MKSEKKPEIKPEMKKCDCGPECNCGCNEGKECHCGDKCRCGCGKCRCGGKLIALLIVFLAGMGFNELLHGCFGRCPSKARPAPMMSAPHHAMPHAFNGAGTTIIINADGSTDIRHGAKCGCHKHHKNIDKHQHHGKMPMPKTGDAPIIDKAAAE